MKHFANTHTCNLVGFNRMAAFGIASLTILLSVYLFLSINLTNNVRRSDLKPYRRREWISISVCWSENTLYWNKTAYPYKEAAVLSVRLWNLISGHQPIVQVRDGR